MNPGSRRVLSDSYSHTKQTVTWYQTSKNRHNPDKPFLRFRHSLAHRSVRSFKLSHMQTPSSSQRATAEVTRTVVLPESNQLGQHNSDVVTTVVMKIQSSGIWRRRVDWHSLTEGIGELAVSIFRVCAIHTVW